MERPDWADGLEAKGGIADQLVHTHNLETEMVPPFVD